MRVTRQFWWFDLTKPIIGFDEGEPGTGGQGGESGQGASEGAGSTGEGGTEGQGAGGTGDEGQGAGEDTAGLKSALQKERQDRKAMEKELKALRKADEDRANAEKSEVQRATDAEAATKSKVEKLAAGFRKNALHSAVLKAAGEAKFLDPSDALRPEVLDAVVIEQDEDDPSQITVDTASVTKAVKALAATKKHYLAAPQEKQRQAPKSGSSFGGSGTQSNLTADEQALAQKYPALRGRI